jgi:hypothetical protein
LKFEQLKKLNYFIQLKKVKKQEFLKINYKYLNIILDDENDNENKFFKKLKKFQ